MSMTAKRAKFVKVIEEFKSGRLNIGKSDKTVSNPKQAIAIALSESGQSGRRKRRRKRRRA